MTFALAHPDLAEAMVADAGDFLSLEYRELLMESLEDVAEVAVVERADDLASR